MLGRYDIDLVILSVIVAVMASYVALDLAGRVSHTEGRASRWWLMGGAFAMGAGIWSMHFIGMLAFSLPIPLRYDLGITFISLLIAVLVSGFALSAVSRPTFSSRQLLASGLFMGVGICAMHYTGMMAMHMFPPVRYDPVLFAASVLIAVGASIVALHLAFILRARAKGRNLLYRILSAIVMGFAIAGMHYTGMAAARFDPNSVCAARDGFDLANEALAYVIGTGILSLLAVTLIASIFDSYMYGHRVQMLKGLEEANRELHFINDIVSQTTKPFGAADLQGRLIRWNRAYEQLTGYSAEELRNMPVQQLSSGRWPDRDAEKIAEVIKTGRAVQFENEFRRKDGSVVPVSTLGDVYRNDKGEIECVYAFITDISERNRVAAELEKSNSELRFISDVIRQTVQPFAAVDLQGRMIRWNPAFEALVGYGADELRNMPVLQLSSGRWPERDLQKISESLKLGEPVQYENEYRRKDGTVLQAQVVGDIYRDAEGNSVCAYAFLTDLTERKRIQNALEDSEAHIRAIVDTAVDGIIVIDDRQHITAFNPAAERIFGYGASETIGKNIRMLMPEPYRQEHDSYVGNYLATGEKKIIGIGREVVGLRKDGSSFPMDLAVAEIRLGQMRMFTGTVRDITDRKAAEESLRKRAREVEQANLELERSNKELEQFAFATAHDLQSPLRGIVSFAQLLQRKAGDKLDQEAAEYMRRIVDGTHSMQRLVQSLLEYSRISNRPDRHWADLNYLLVEAKDELIDQIDGRGAVIESATLPTLYVDARQIAQLLRSLVSNAIKFQPGERPQVRITARQGVHEWIIGVADKGIGIPAEHHKRIFQIFQRLHTPEQYEGAGVGLALSEKIVHNHGGRLWVESTPGGGATFYFSIPEYSGDG